MNDFIDILSIYFAYVGIGIYQELSHRTVLIGNLLSGKLRLVSYCTAGVVTDVTSSRHGAPHTGDALLPPTRQGRFDLFSFVTAQTSMGV